MIPAPHLLYVDPGSGSFLVQVIVGSLVAIGFATRRFLQRVGSAIARVFRRRP